MRYCTRIDENRVCDIQKYGRSKDFGHLLPPFRISLDVSIDVSEKRICLPREYTTGYRRLLSAVCARHRYDAVPAQPGRTGCADRSGSLLTGTESLSGLYGRIRFTAQAITDSYRTIVPSAHDPQAALLVLFRHGKVHFVPLPSFFAQDKVLCKKAVPHNGERP